MYPALSSLCVPRTDFAGTTEARLRQNRRTAMQLSIRAAELIGNSASLVRRSEVVLQTSRRLRADACVLLEKVHA